ncbi:MAG: TetR/AcrR family transcriptional regulator [Roseinatronobacter sp.]|nr:MAG: TetR/AcrR family transcriptional regulator [Roseinatronobacter sp.]
MDIATSRRQRLSPEERHKQILDSAVAYFAEHGLDGNTRDLSKQMGVTQSLIFKYFATKAELIEAVYNRVYLDRIAPHWPELIKDSSRPLRDRLVQFYTEYAQAIFTYEWMRIFMFSGLAGAELNRRYLDHLSTLILQPILTQIRAEAKSARLPDFEDVWNLHGGIVYIGIRKYVYQMPTADPDAELIARAVDRFLKDFAIPIDSD